MNIKKFTLGPLSTNAYLMENGEDSILFDAPPSSGKIVEYIKERGLKLKALLLTHGHFDHIRGLKDLLKYDENLKIYIGAKEQDFLSSPYKNMSLLWFPYYSNFNPKDLNLETLKEGDKVFNFDVIESPGHTIGGITFVEYDANLAISGDNAFSKSTGSFRLPTGNKEELGKSIKRLYDITSNNSFRILPGHGEEITSDNLVPLMAHFID